MVPAETDPEVSIGWAELRDELLYDLLLRSRLHAQQLTSIPSAGELCLGEVQPPPQLGEVGKLVARLPFSCLAHTLTCNHTHTHTHKHITSASCAPITFRCSFTGVIVEAFYKAVSVAYLWLRIYPLQEPSIQHRIGKADREETKDGSIIETRIHVIVLLCFLCVSLPVMRLVAADGSRHKSRSRTVSRSIVVKPANCRSQFLTAPCVSVYSRIPLICSSGELTWHQINSELLLQGEESALKGS